MMSLILRCIGAFLGTVGFSFLLDAPRKTIFPASLIALLSYLIYELMAVGLEQSMIFSYFFATVVIQLLEKVLIAVFGCRLVGLILHFEHDRHIFVALSIIAEDEVTFATCRGVVVLLEVGTRHSSTQVLLKLGGTMLL